MPRNPVHPVNRHLIPKLRFDNFPQSGGTSSDAQIASRMYGQVLRGEIGVTEARRKLWTYANREHKLCSFDRMLMDSLANCAERPSPFIA